MKIKRRRIIMIVLVILGVFILAAVIWFLIPYSPARKEFERDVGKLKEQDRLTLDGEVFTAEEFEKFPEPIKKYVERCGYICKQKMSYMKMYYEDVGFKTGRKGARLKIDYTSYNFVSRPDRLAFIDSSMFGVPFQGYDYFSDGKGGMKGTLAKLITLFDQKGDSMDKACLVTYLSESLFAPNILLGDLITFEEIDSHSVKATITYKGMSASGVFNFNDDFEMTSFVTDDRSVANSDGTYENVRWSAECGSYEQSESGIRYPTSFKAVWHYPDEDFVYFDGKIKSISYDCE